MADTSKIREHMEIVGADGVHVGTVDRVEGERIKLTKMDDHGSHSHHHRYLSLTHVASVDSKVWLAAKSEIALGEMEKEDGSPFQA